MLPRVVFVPYAVEPHRRQQQICAPKAPTVSEHYGVFEDLSEDVPEGALFTSGQSWVESSGHPLSVSTRDTSLASISNQDSPSIDPSARYVK